MFACVKIIKYLHNLQFNTKLIGKKIIYLPICPSTNLYAAQMTAKETIEEGTLVITEQQTEGRGQQGSQWQSQSYQNLTFSIILKPHFLPVLEQFYLSIVTSLSISEALKTYLISEKVKIKWPNDILYEKNKLCGILIENSLKKDILEYAIVGIGLNVNQVYFQNERASSMKLVSGQHFILADVLSKIVEFFDYYYLKLKNFEGEVLRKLYLESLFGYQEKYYYKTNVVFEGEVMGVDKQGKLLLKTAKGVQSYNFKEVSLVY